MWGLSSHLDVLRAFLSGGLGEGGGWTHDPYFYVTLIVKFYQTGSSASFRSVVMQKYDDIQLFKRTNLASHIWVILYTIQTVTFAFSFTAVLSMNALWNLSLPRDQTLLIWLTKWLTLSPTHLMAPKPRGEQPRSEQQNAPENVKWRDNGLPVLILRTSMHVSWPN